MSGRHRELATLGGMLALFGLLFSLPEGSARIEGAVLEALYLTRDYAREHVLFCLVPAFFIAGGIAVFLSQASVMRYLGARANKVVAYGVASVSGTVLAVCSCTVLPLFAGIYRMGAGLGPAVAFLYSGPAINILAIVLTARVLGPEMGVARAVGALVFSVVIGLLMHLLFRSEEMTKAAAASDNLDLPPSRPLPLTALHFATMVGILVFANWGRPTAGDGLWRTLYEVKWLITGVFAAGFAVSLWRVLRVRLARVVSVAAAVAAAAFLAPSRPMVPFAIGVIGLSVALHRESGEPGEWLESTWGFAKQILPLLFIGVLVAGALLGRPGHEGLIPSAWVAGAVGGNSLSANLFASVAGAFMYFATLTEVPILEGLMGNGMGKGPALALLLAGPALSLPNMLVIRSVMGTRKTIAFVSLVVVMATVAGMIYGNI